LPFASRSGTLGENVSTTWNGLMWMWNGCEMFGFAVAFVIVHSSTVFSSATTPIMVNASTPSRS